MLIAVPSKGRAGVTTINKMLPNICTFFIPKSEYHQYKGIVKKIEIVPNEIKGITATRNFILKNTNDKNVVMLDDDVKNAGYVKRHKNNVNHIKLNTEPFWIDEFKKYFDLCDQLNYKIWGITTDDSTKSAYSYKPIMFKTYALGSCMGIINDGSYYFNESFPVKEDYELSLRHIKQEGGILGIKYLYWANKHYKDEGGCKDYRTVKMERECIKKLIEMYPGMIAKVKRKGSAFSLSLIHI